MKDELTDDESAQLSRLKTAHKVATIILMRWGWLLAFTFISLFAAMLLFLVFHTANSDHRYTATTRLLYNPRQIAKVQNMNDKQLMSILERASVKRRVGNVLSMPEAEKACLTIDLTIEQMRQPSNLFELQAQAPSLVNAAKKVNCYAEQLIDEYVAYRTREIDNWRGSLDVRKKSLQGRLAEIEAEENTLKGQAGVAAPVETLTMLNNLLSDQRRNLSALSVQIANEEMRCQKLAKTVGKAGEAIAANAPTIRQKSAAIAAIDKEIAALREIYTDKNPKVTGKIDDRKRLMDDYMAFLKSKGIGDIDFDRIDQIEAAASEMAESAMRAEVVKENKRALESEVKENEKRSKQLTSLIPALEKLKVHRGNIEQTMRDLDDQLESIAYLQASMKNDLIQIERAGGGDGTNPLRAKNFIFALVGAGFCVASLAIWFLATGLAFGNVAGGKELAAYDDIRFLGSLPHSGKLSEADEKDVLGIVALKFSGEDCPKGVVLVCRLPGAEVQPKFREVLTWSLAMSGEQSFALEVVSDDGSERQGEPGEGMLSTVCTGNKGWFPVANRYALAPTELQMLQADLAALREQYDHVFVHIQDGIRRGGSFLDQLLSACDSVILVTGTGSTPRSWFRYARKHLNASGKPVMAIATGAPTRIIRREMESKG